ncbi:hypothetical protein GCM10027075_69360 [Streptomyces heilongjiangensis]
MPVKRACEEFLSDRTGEPAGLPHRPGNSRERARTQVTTGSGQRRRTGGNEAAGRGSGRGPPLVQRTPRIGSMARDPSTATAPATRKSPV